MDMTRVSLCKTLAIAAICSFCVEGALAVDGMATSISRDLNVIVAEALCQNSPLDIEVAECAVVYCVTSGARIATASVGNITPDFPYEPGSVIKTLTAVAAIDHGVATMETGYATNLDDPKYQGLPEDGCHVWPEKMSVSDALVRSSNVVFGKLGADVGVTNLLSTFVAFGLGSQSGRLTSLNREQGRMTSRLSVGLGLTSTLDELARGYVILANHGKSPWTGREIVSQRAADAVAAVLRRVPTKEGTAGRAAVPGVIVAGKTGTTQVIEGDRPTTRYHGTFIGFFPADNPLYVVAVLARGKPFRHKGGYYPALAFSQIARALMKQ